MPSLVTIQAATPKCPGTHTNLGTLGGLARQIPCGRPMWWDFATERWNCANHGFRAFAPVFWEAA